MADQLDQVRASVERWLKVQDPSRPVAKIEFRQAGNLLATSLVHDQVCDASLESIVEVLQENATAQARTTVIVCGAIAINGDQVATLTVRVKPVDPNAPEQSPSIVSKLEGSIVDYIKQQNSHIDSLVNTVVKGQSSIIQAYSSALDQLSSRVVEAETRANDAFQLAREAVQTADEQADTARKAIERRKPGTQEKFEELGMMFLAEKMGLGGGKLESMLKEHGISMDQAEGFLRMMRTKGGGGGAPIDVQPEPPTPADAPAPAADGGTGAT